MTSSSLPELARLRYLRFVGAEQVQPSQGSTGPLSSSCRMRNFFVSLIRPKWTPSEVKSTTPKCETFSSIVPRCSSLFSGISSLLGIALLFYLAEVEQRIPPFDIDEFVRLVVVAVLLRFLVPRPIDCDDIAADDLILLK